MLSDWREKTSEGFTRELMFDMSEETLSVRFYIDRICVLKKRLCSDVVSGVGVAGVHQCACHRSVAEE